MKKKSRDKMKYWYYYDSVGKQGPYSSNEIRQLIDSGIIQFHMVLEDSVGQQSMLRYTPEFCPLTPSTGTSFSMGQLVSSWENQWKFKESNFPADSTDVDKSPSTLGANTTFAFVSLVKNVYYDLKITNQCLWFVPEYNIRELLLNILLFFVCVFVPYYNLGAFIGLFYGIPAKLANQTPIDPKEILLPQYRTAFHSILTYFSLSFGAFLLCVLPIVSVCILLLMTYSLLGGIHLYLVTWTFSVVLFTGFSFIVVLLLFICFGGIFTCWSSVMFDGLFAPLLICDKRMEPEKALVYSINLMKGHKLSFFTILLLLSIPIALVLLLSYYIALRTFMIVGLLFCLIFSIIPIIIYLSLKGFYYAHYCIEIERDSIYSHRS